MYDLEKMLMVLIVVICIFLFAIVLYILKMMQDTNKELKLREYEININTNTGEETFTILDKMVLECFAEYTALNVEYKDIDYISSDLEKEITTAVSHKVIDRMSPTLMSKIALVYNINNISVLISERVYLHTLNYTIEKNSIKE